MGENGRGAAERRGTGGWETVLEAERPLTPGSEWHSELYRVAVDQFRRAADLLDLEEEIRARLRLGQEAVVEVKGLRNPCAQLDEIAPGLMKAVLDRDADGEIVRKSGVMGVVLEGGEVRPGDPIEVELPTEPHVRLAPV